MKISVLQHAACEGPGEIAAWATRHHHPVSIHHLYRGEPVPSLDDFDLLVVMGGEMNIYQYRDYKWLRVEADLIRRAMLRNKRVVGICLGAQLIADALGSRVYQNPFHELGWFPVMWTTEAQTAFPHLQQLQDGAVVLHWHGDTFSTPQDAIRLGVSKGCVDQGFVIPGKCLALQFTDWPAGPYVQTPDAIISEAPRHHQNTRHILHGMLDQFCQGIL